MLVPADTTGVHAVLYALDAQDLFDPTTAAGGEEWALDELLDARPRLFPPVLVVGIESAPDHLRDAAPPGSRDDARGELLLRWIATVVRPHVETRYAVAQDARRTIVMGAGASGLFALYAAWMRPDVFGAGVCLDLPDFDARTAAWLDAPPRAPLRLWIAQTGGEAAARPSAAGWLETLRKGAHVDYVLTGPRATRVATVSAALRAVLPVTSPFARPDAP